MKTRKYRLVLTRGGPHAVTFNWRENGEPRSLRRELTEEEMTTGELSVDLPDSAFLDGSDFPVGYWLEAPPLREDKGE